MLFPAFRLQQALQRHTLGETEWTKIAGKINQKRLDEIYARKHGGMPRPTFKSDLVYSDRLGPRIFRQTCCCLIPHLGVPLRGPIRDFCGWRYLMCPAPDEVLLEVFEVDTDRVEPALARYFADATDAPPG